MFIGVCLESCDDPCVLVCWLSCYLLFLALLHPNCLLFHLFIATVASELQQFKEYGHEYGAKALVLKDKTREWEVTFFIQNGSLL